MHFVGNTRNGATPKASIDLRVDYWLEAAALSEFVQQNLYEQSRQDIGTAALQSHILLGTLFLFHVMVEELRRRRELWACSLPVVLYPPLRRAYALAVLQTLVQTLASCLDIDCDDRRQQQQQQQKEEEQEQKEEVSLRRFSTSFQCEPSSLHNRLFSPPTHLYLLRLVL